MEEKEYRGVDFVALVTENAELRKLLAKAKEDADYWREQWDKSMKHLEHQNSYIRHLEQQVWGGHTF